MSEKDLWAGRELRAHSPALLPEQKPDLLFLARIRPRLLCSPPLPPAALKKGFRNPQEPDPCRHRTLPLPVEAQPAAHRPGPASPDSSTDSTPPIHPPRALRTVHVVPLRKL